MAYLLRLYLFFIYSSFNNFLLKRHYFYIKLNHALVKSTINRRVKELTNRTSKMCVLIVNFLDELFIYFKLFFSFKIKQEWKKLQKNPFPQVLFVCFTMTRV